METKSYDTIEQLADTLPVYGSIHIECNREQSEELLGYMAVLWKEEASAFLTAKDKGYERQTVKEYLRFFHELAGDGRRLGDILEQFGLTAIRKRKMHTLKPGDYTKVGIARVSMQKAGFYFLEEPLLNLDGEDMKRVLSWIEERSGEGAGFITTNSSLRHAIMMAGAAFYMEEGKFCEVEQENEEPETESREIEILKIPVKSGASTLLFEPKDIDYIESLDKCVYLSVRGTLFQTQKTMYELEEVLKKVGFFRCHRSYLVNIQKVERFEKWTKNSYVLILDDTKKSQIPLAKGRIEEMKETFHW